MEAELEATKEKSETLDIDFLVAQEELDKLEEDLTEAEL